MNQQQYIDHIRSGNRRFMAKAITLIESTLPKKFEQGQAILEHLLPFTGNALRLGITGVPGVGKSTFIEALGLHLIEQGHRVAVLSIDPSSPLTGGSIMGDKTRMPLLASQENAFIRPSPSGGLLGGVARKTREIMMICEAAHYDVVIVETVGIGQSEVMASTMVDCFLTLMLPNAGDELQGIKKGIMELAHLIVINKADGKNQPQAQYALAEYSKALKLLHMSEGNWSPKVLTCSALEKIGIDRVWKTIQDYQTLQKNSGKWKEHRQTQARHWMWSLVENELQIQFRQHPKVQQLLIPLEQAVLAGNQHPTTAARQLLEAWHTAS